MGVHVDTQAVLVLYSQGLMSGTVLDCGDGVSHVIPVFDGFVLPNCTERLNVAGRHLTQRLIDLLVKRGYSFNRTADMETARLIKDKYCYVALDAELETKLANETTTLTETLTLPDGRNITLNAERLFAAIQKAPIDTRQALYEHIVLSGGSTMFPGLPTRIEKDLNELYRTRVDDRGKMKITVHAEPRRRHMVFMGGSVLADITRNKGAEWWLTKEEWDAKGADALKLKCPLQEM